MRRTVIALALGLLLTPRVWAQEMESAQGAPSADALIRKLGFDPNRSPELSPEQHEHARVIGRDVVCLCGTCPKEPVTDCTCGWAAMNRRAIQHAVAQGMPRAEILAAYREVYGERGLAMIPKDGFAQLAWIFPYAAALLALAGVIWMGVRLKQRQSAPASEPNVPAPRETTRDDVRADLARQLDDLD